MTAVVQITHQGIAQRRSEIAAKRKAAQDAAAAPFDRESKSLQELCGGLGHIYVPRIDGMPDCGRCCGVCGADAPKI